MGGKDGMKEPVALVIAYKQLGTISIDEFAQAILTDLHALRDVYNVRYVTAPRLKIHASNEYGDLLKVYRPEGGSVRFMDSWHYRPSCKDYEL